MITFVVGTRPEVMKMAPVFRALHRRSDVPEPMMLATGQHAHLLAQQTGDRGIPVDWELHVMTERQPLDTLTAKLVEEITPYFDGTKISKPQLVLVQGDTTTAFAAALAAFYQRVPVGHVEAGLRTKTLYAPFPEEMNRRLISRLATLHFAPNMTAWQHLADEGIDQHVHITGNTIVDELLSVKPTGVMEDVLKTFHGKHVVLITCHRRERQAQRIECLVNEVRSLARWKDIEIVWPLHPNPDIKDVVEAQLRHEHANVHLLSPLAYAEFVGLLRRADAVITDSGGVIEEATTLCKPTFIIRDETERPEALTMGARLVPLSAMHELTANVLRAVGKPRSGDIAKTYGDGRAGERIAEHIAEWYRSRRDAQPA